MKYLCKSGCGKEVSGKDRNCYICANSGKNNPAWQGGKAKEKYKGFDRQIRKQIRFRDGFKCQLCGKKQTTFGEKTNNLEIHHIDYTKTNTVANNLIALCKVCHIATNFDRDKWIKKFAEIFKMRGLYQNE